MYREVMLNEFSERRRFLLKEISELQARLSLYERGTLVIQNDYAYIKYYENGKTVSKYVGKHLNEVDILELKRKLKNYHNLQIRIKENNKELKEIEKLILKYGGTL